MKRCWTNEEAPDGARTEASAARGWVRRRAVAAVCWGLVTGTAVAVPFTYQGRLVDGTALANGNYELRFRLFDSVAAGTQVGGEVSLPTVGVTNGLFTVQLEFGNGVFARTGGWNCRPGRPAIPVRCRYSTRASPSRRCPTPCIRWQVPGMPRR
jgi:hypothetical protein